MHMPPDTDHPAPRRPPAGNDSLGDSPLAHYLHALWRFRWLLVGGSVLAAVVTYLIALTLTPRFEATAVLMVTASKTGEQVAPSASTSATSAPSSRTARSPPRSSRNSR